MMHLLFIEFTQIIQWVGSASSEQPSREICETSINIVVYYENTMVYFYGLLIYVT